MGTVYARGNKLWLAFKDGQGKRCYRSAGLSKGEEKQAQRLLEEVEAQVERGEVLEVEDLSEITVTQYAKKWVDGRRDRVKTIDDEERRLKLHTLPHIGHFKVRAVRPRHLRDWVLKLRAGGKLAPRTIITTYSAARTMFRDAVVDEIIDANPCVLSKGVLPKKEDKDPEWRSKAIYTREEVQQLISDSRILPDRRVFYALKALTGGRHGELVALRWKHYDDTEQPLGKLIIASSYQRKGTKTGVTREVPVHPVLAEMLQEWRDHGFKELVGRKPETDDFIIPTRNLTMRDKKDAFDALKLDLKTLGFRERRGHDLRRTFISLSLVDGARRDLLEVVTHGTRGDIISVYSTFPWPALCAEVAKLNVRRTDPTGNPEKRVTIGVTVSKEGPDPSMNPGLYKVTPPGIEPGFEA